MLGNNQPNEEIIDPELAKAKKSMGWRVDPDTPPKTEEKPPETPETPPAKVETPEPETPLIPKPDDLNEDGTPKTIETPEPAKVPKIERPETYIPMPKYLSEKKDWEKDKALLVDATKKIEELTALAGQKDGAQKDEDIEAFMEKTGFDKETVEGFLELAQKRLASGQSLSEEERNAVTKATTIVHEAEIEAAFAEEFKNLGEPVVMKAYPNAKPEQLTAVKEYLDKVSHTLENKDKPLEFLIWKNQDEIGKIFTEPAPETPPQTKKTLEPTRMGNGKQTTLSAADYADGKTDFGTLAELDASVRSEIIKNFDPKTYASFLTYAKGQSQGLEVTRNGQKVVLK